jgi:hypothetical protein
LPAPLQVTDAQLDKAVQAEHAVSAVELHAPVTYCPAGQVEQATQAPLLR